MGKQKNRNTDNFFEGFDSTQPDPNNEFFTDATTFKRGSFSSLEDTNSGINLDDYRDYMKKGVFSVNSALDNTRPRNQSNWEQTYHAALKFVPNVALEILNQAGNMLDVEDYANADNEVGNWLSDWAMARKEEINEANPIYRENPGEALDVGDYAWWMENGSALAESVTAFAAIGAVTGMGVSRLVTNGAKAYEWLAGLNKAVTGTNTGKKVIQGANTLSTAFLLNHAEGMGIATTVYNEIYQEELNKLNAEGVENAEELAKDKASRSAVTALDTNKINILLNLSSASLFVKAPKLSRQIRRQASLKESFKRANIEGVQEGLEETINLIAENKALNEDYSMNRALQDAFSKEGLESALLGYIGGAGQTAITNGGRKIKLQRDKDGIRQSAYSLQNQAFNEQNASKERISALTKGKRISENTDALMRANEVFELQKQIVEAEANKDLKKSEELKAKLLSNQAFDAFSNGTTEQLINVFEGIKNMDEVAAKEQGLEPETYKQKAEEAIAFIKGLENEYNKAFEYLNTSDVYNNRSRNVKLRLTNKKLESNKNILQQEAINDLKEFGLTDEQITINEDDNLVIKSKGFVEQAKQLESVQLYASLIENIKENKKEQQKLAKEYIELTSSKTQKAIKNAITNEKRTVKRQKTQEESNVEVEKQTTQKTNVTENIVKKQQEQQTPVSSNTGQETVEISPKETTVKSDFTFSAPVPELEQYAEGGNKIITSNLPIDNKIDRLNKVIKGLEKIQNLKGVKGLIAQYNKAIRVLEGNNEVIQNNQAIANNQKANIKNKLQQVAETLTDTTDDNAPISNEDKNKIYQKVDVLIDALNTMEDAGYNTADFKTVADAMLETVGEEKFINIFEDFKAVYNLTNKAPYKVTDTYEDLYLTAEEREAILDHKKALEISMFLQDFYNLTNAEFEAQKREVLKTYVEEQGYTVYDKDTLTKFEGYKVVEGFNKVAYLAKRYTNNIDVSSNRFNVLDFFISKQDIDRNLNENVDEVLLDPDMLKAGEEITFQVLDEVVYDDGTIVTKEGKIEKDGEITNRSPEDIAPIALFYKGKQIKGAFLHTTDWINKDNIADKNDVNRQKNLLRKIRQTILKSDTPITTTITERNDGWLMSDIKGNKDLVSVNLPKVDIAVGKDNALFQGDEVVNTANKHIVNGLPYAVIPVNTNKKVGVPVQPLLLSEKPEYIDSILNAVKIYLNGTLTDVADKVYTESGFNLTDINDLERYINQFIYLTPYQKGDNNNYTFDAFKNSLNQWKDNGSIVRFVDGNIQYGRGLGLNGSVGYLNKQEVNKLPTNNNVRQQFIDAEILKLKDVLENNIYINVNKELLNQEFDNIIIKENDATILKLPYNDFIKEHLKTSLYSATLPNGKEVYTVQSNINFDDNFALSTKKQKVKEEKTEVVEDKITKDNTTYTFGDLSSEENEFDLAPKILTDEEVAILKENTPESLLIQGVSLNTQNVIINHLTSRFLQYAIKENDTNKAFDFITHDFPDVLLAALRHYNDVYRETNSVADLRNANIVKALKENYSKLTNITVNKLKQVNNLNVDLTAKTIKALNEEVSSIEDVEEEFVLDYKELNNWENDASFRENIKEKMSTNLKNLFSYIEDASLNKDGNIVPKRGILGITQTIPTDIVINDLNAILAYHNDLNNEVVTEPSFDNMIKVLNTWLDKKPYLYNVLEELNNADEKTKNEFVQVMSKHYTNHIYVSKDAKNRYYVNNSDNNVIVNAIQKNWYNNIVNNGLITLSDNDEFIVNKNKLKTIKEDYKTLIDTFNNEDVNKYELTSNLFNKLGLNFDNRLIKVLVDNGIKQKGKNVPLIGLLKNSNGAIKNYIDTLTKLENKNLQDNHPFQNNSSLSSFAREIGKLDPIYFANSFKDVRGKSYFGYSNNKFLVDRVKNLKHNKKGLLDNLANQPFTQNSVWVQQLINNPKFAEYFNYFTFDGISKPNKKEGIKLEYASPSEVEEAKLALFYSKTKYAPRNKGKVPSYIVNLFYPTTSNKTVQYGIQTLGEEWGKGLINGELHKRQLNKLFDIIVQPEINRILSLQNEPNKYNVKAYDKGGLMFHFIPALNSMKELWNKDGSLKTNIPTDLKLKEKVLNAIKNYTSDLVEDKLSKWEEYGFIQEFDEIQDVDEQGRGIIVKPTKLSFSERYKNDSYGAKKEAYNFVLNYLVSNVNIFQTFATDPAFYWKSNEYKNIIKNEAILNQMIKDGYGDTIEEVKNYINNSNNPRQEVLPYYTKENWIAEHEDTFNNIGKRLAGDAAPGVDLPDSANNTFKLGYLKDNERPVHLYSYYKALLGSNAKDYLKANATDAQEFTTLKEHLYVLNKQGKVSTKDMETLLNADKNGIDFNTLNLEKPWQKLVFQPLKPVYVQNVWKSGIEHRVYVKSSSFPLFKQLTKDLQIDKLRQAMENQKVDRVAYESAVKIGGTNSGTQIFDDNANVKDNIKIDVIGDLTREGFKIQQEVPYNEAKENINDGTQQIKLLTGNIRDIKGFIIPNEPDSSYTGQDIQDKLDEAYTELFEINYNNLVNELEYDAITGNININKLSQILQEEAIQRNYPLYEIEALKTEIKSNGEENFVVPLWLTGVSGKLEAMLNSIVNNRVRKLKPKGKSYVLGSSEGFAPSIKEGQDAQETINNTNGIVWDKEWYANSKGQLSPMRIKDTNGKLYGEPGFEADKSYVEYAEILVPFKFKDNEGNILSINDYTDENGFIDTTKLPNDLLKLFGFRIPTQYLNSMSAIKIVGFLPKQSGDLLLAPADWTVQMGSDFDVDKLYSNSYNTLYNEETGELSVLREGDNRKKVLENRILDLHFAILGNPNPEVQKRILKPLDFGMLKELGEELLPYVDNRLKGIGISESYQSWKYLNARAGKAGIGVFSTDNTFIAQVQNKDINLITDNDNYYALKLDNQIANSVSNPRTIRGKRDKTDVISAYQSLAVDDENEQGLFKLNINNTTFDAIRTLVMSGFEEDTISYFINQPIIREYTRLKIKADDSISNFNEFQIVQELNKMFPITETTYTLNDIEFEQKYGNPSKEILLANIKGKVDNNVQQILLKQFLEATELGKNIQYVQSAINTHSAGFGKDLFYSTIKENQVLGLNNFAKVDNASNLIGDYFTFRKLNDKQLNAISNSSNPLYQLLYKWNLSLTDDNVKLDLIKEVQKQRFKPVNTIYYKGVMSDVVQFIKPTTLAGIVSTNALMLNNSLWSRFFPYNNVGVNKSLDTILDILGRGDRLATQAGNKKAAFDNLKSFTISAIANTYTDVNDNITTERNRLLIDTKENKSLATIIHTLRSSGKLNNAIINRLELDLKKELLPSLITYQAATAENIDERHLHSAFSAMLLNDSIDLGTFNGIQYTPRKIAQDLITHQLLSGGVQKATQFIKYIPINYLKSIGYYNALENINFEDYREVNPYNVQNQYIQHNPKKVELNEEVIKQLSKNYDTFNEGVVIKKKPLIKPIALPKVFSIPYKQALSGYKLYFYDNGIKGWVQKDTLGTKDILEYAGNKPFGTTIIKSNKTPNVVIDTLPTDPKNVKSFLDNTKLEDLESTDVIHTPSEKLEDIYNLNSTDSTVNKLGFILDRVINNENSDGYTKLMAKEAIKNLDKISDYKFIVNNLLNAQGSHNINDKTIKINPSVHSTKEEFEKTIIEEVIHALTKKAILDNNTGEVARLKALKNEAERGVLAYLNKKFNGKGQEMINTVKDKISNKQSPLYGEALTQFEADIIYPIINETEFVGRLFKSKKIQEILNNTPSSIKGKSILDNVWDFIINTLKEVGININKDSALEYALKDTISLINLPKPTENQIAEVQKAEPTYRTPEFIYKLFNIQTDEGFHPVTPTLAKKVIEFVEKHTSNLEATFDGEYVIVKNKDKYKDLTLFDNIEETTDTEEISKDYELFPGVFANSEQRQAIKTKPLNTDEDLNPLVATQQEGKARPLLLAYNNRIKRLQKNINKAEAQKNFERVENLKELLEDVINKRNETLALTSLRNRSQSNSDLYYKGVQDLEEASNMLNGNRTITLEDTLYIRKILHFWQKSTSVLFDAEDRKSEALLKDFKGLEMEAETLEDKLVIFEEKFINDFIRKHGNNITVQEIFENFKDINGLTAKALDISRSGNELLDSVFLSIKNANIDALDEGNELLKDLDNLEAKIRPILKQMGHDELYEVFRQRNKNGKLTGHLVKRFSNDFSRNLYSRINALYKNNTVANFESLLEWSKDNVKIVNLDYLFSNTLTNEDKVKAEKYKQDLKQELGDKHYSEFIEKQAEQINSYKSRLSAKLRDMATKYGVKVSDIVKDSKYKKEINNWDAVNSPYKFYKHLQEKIDDVANPQISKLTNFKNFNNINFITIIPKNESAYDENYKKIENNETLLEFYNYYRKVDDTLKSYLPEDTKRTLSYTGIPFVKKTILNLYKDKGMKVGLTAIWDNISNSVRSLEESTLALSSIDPVTNKKETELRVNLSNNNSEEITKYVNLKTIEANSKGIKVTNDMIAAWKEEKIDELAQLKSYDLAKILKVYTLTTLAYKHKSKIEDSIELAQNILNTQKEYMRTNNDEFVTDEEGRKVKPKNPEQSFLNLKKQFEYAIDVFKGKSKDDEGVTKTKVLTASEKAEKKQMEALKKEIETAFNNGKLDATTYNNNLTLLDSYIDGLGGYAVNSKRGDNVLKWVQLVKMGWNVMSSIANVGFGYIANRIEASGGQLYTNAQLTEAYKLTTNSIWKNATFNKVETPVAKKIRALMDKWDILKDASHEMFQRPLDIDLGRNFKWISPYNITQRTEYINQAPIMVAMMMNINLRDLGVNSDDNLWDAYGTDGKWNTKKYGKEPNNFNNKIKVLRNKIDQVNKMNHGNYDPNSALALKKEFWGRAISQFRTWMFEGYAVRFEGEKSDALLGTRKGRYLSVRDFYKEQGFSKATVSVLKGLTRSLTLGTVFKNSDFSNFNLKDVDAANLRKTMTEIGMYTTLYTSYLLLKAMNDGLDDDDDRKYALNLLINQGMRLKTDIMFYINPGEFKNLLRDLVPATSIITDSMQFIGAVGDFVQGEDEIGTGIYSGNSRLLRESMQLLPVGTQVYKTINYGLQTFDK